MVHESSSIHLRPLFWLGDADAVVATTGNCQGGSYSKRLVVLGASNLALGGIPLMRVVRSREPDPTQIFMVAGYGRSYGVPSTFVARRYPSICDSAVWVRLRSSSPIPTRAFLTDIGNDIMHGRSAAQILRWVEECVRRLRDHTNDITITSLPLAALKKVSPLRYRFIRAAFFPSSHTPYSEALTIAAHTADGLERLAALLSLRFCRPQPHWFGLDPIHVRNRYRPEAWSTILYDDAVSHYAA